VSKWWSPPEGKLNWVPYLYFLQGMGKGYPKSGIKAMVGGWGNPFDQHNMANSLKKRAASGDIELLLETGGFETKGATLEMLKKGPCISFLFTASIAAMPPV
jgi:hypothetical protein